VTQNDNAYLAALEKGPKYDFEKWPNSIVPRIAAGAYTVWLRNKLAYVGMAGRRWKEKELRQRREEGKRAIGLYRRLASHARGTRGGDQFCLAVFDYYILPDLTRDEIEKTKREIEKTKSDKPFFLDELTKNFIRQNLSYRFVKVPDGRTASQLESTVKKTKRPLLNRM